MKQATNKTKSRFHAAMARLVCCMAVTCLAFLSLPLTPASAQAFSQLGVRQEDINGDGRPDVTVIDGQIVTSHDIVRVYDSGENMPAGDDWRKITDFTDDIWTFDFRGDGSVELVIRFGKQNGDVYAELFDDQNGDHKVALEVAGKDVHITESAYAPLKVFAQGDWYLPNGQLNWNLRFQTDGPSVSHVNSGFDMSQLWRSFLKLDGRPDIELEFKDQDRDGIPEYGLWRLLAASPPYTGSTGKTFIWSNHGAHRPLTPTGFLFWPYVSVHFSTAQNYFDAPPSILLDWNAADLRYVSFAGYPIEQGFHVNSFAPFEKDKVNYANFENMQAYYDLADDHDGFPELHIRHRYFAQGDPYNFGYRMSTGIDEIRWSWNQTNQDGPRWDYKLGLAGRYTIDSEVHFPDFAYNTIPYAELPGWVTSHRWDYATFVAKENNNFQGSEGIYLWGAVEQPVGGDASALSRYLAGDLSVDVDQAFQVLPPGWRGDVAAELAAQPYLYFSPIDRKLHLLHASSGVWNIDDRALIRYKNLDGDAYLDQVTYSPVITGQSTLPESKQLTIAKSYLLYSDDTTVAMRRTEVEPSLFETLPPADHQQWKALGTKLAAAAHTFAPDDFRAMMQQFPGPEMTIIGAYLLNYRTIGATGFRFVLVLQPGFQAQGSDLLNLAQLKPGSYVVTYDGGLTIAALTAPEPSASITSTTLTQLQKNAISVRLQNQGLSDIPSATLELWAAPTHGSATLVTTQTVMLPAQTPLTVVLQWAPPAAGQWTLTPKLRQTNGQLLSFDAATVAVLPAISADSSALIDTTTSTGNLPGILMILIGLAAIAALVWWRQWTPTVIEQSNDTA